MTPNTLPPPAKTPRRRWKILLGFAVSLVFIALALHNVDFHKLLAVFRRLHYGWLLGATAFILLSYLIRSLIWRDLLSAYRPTRPWNLFRIITIGYFANNILPLKIGELIRAWLLGRRENLPTSLALGTVVMERGLDLFALLFYFTLMMLLVPYAPWLKLSGSILAGLAFILFAAISLNYLFGGRFITLLERPLRKLPGSMGQWLHVQLRKFSDGLKLVRSPLQLLRLAGMSLLTWLCWMTVTYACFLATGLKLSFLAAIFLIVVLNFGLMIPSSPGGLGIFEFMVILALRPYGVSKEAALGVGFTFHMLQYLLTMVLGWIFTLQFNVSMVSVYRHPEQSLEEVAAK